MSEQMGFKTKVQMIQTKLKAPKNLFNKFGNYKYRNAEGILEAVKPLLAEYKCYLTIKDDITLVGDRYYVKATATLVDCESDGEVSNNALAREEAEKKGQDSSQTTGSASSYARKYALNGLFLLDDTKDADTDEVHEETTPKAEKPKSNANKESTQEPDAPKATAKQIGDMKAYALKLGVDINKLLEAVKRSRLEELTTVDIDYLNKRLVSTEKSMKENKNE